MHVHAEYCRFDYDVRSSCVDLLRPYWRVLVKSGAECVLAAGVLDKIVYEGLRAGHSQGISPDDPKDFGFVLGCIVICVSLESLLHFRNELLGLFFGVGCGSD